MTNITKETQPLSFEISIRTTLSRIKEICSINTIEGHEIIIKVPKIFAHSMFTGNENQ